jgi:hypothetical protein
MAKLDLQSAINKNVKNSLNNTFSSTENIKQQIVVLDELRSWIPAPTQEEDRQLEANIIANGCRDALTLWETTQQQINPLAPNPNEPAYVLVDGHNRYRICKARSISFNIHLMDFADLKSVKDFMIDLQLGRRNLTPQQVQYFRGLRYLNEKTDKGKYARGKGNELDRSEIEEKLADKKVSTAEKLAAEYKVGKNTIIRDSEYAAGVDQLTPELKQSVLSGAVKVDKGQIQKLGKLNAVEPIGSLSELENVVMGEVTEQPIPDKQQKGIEKAQAQLTQCMKALLEGKPLTHDGLDLLIEKATQVKQLLPILAR